MNKFDQINKSLDNNLASQLLYDSCLLCVCPLCDINYPFKKPCKQSIKLTIQLGEDSRLTTGVFKTVIKLISTKVQLNQTIFNLTLTQLKSNHVIKLNPTLKVYL